MELWPHGASAVVRHAQEACTGEHAQEACTAPSDNSRQLAVAPAADTGTRWVRCHAQQSSASATRQHHCGRRVAPTSGSARRSRRASTQAAARSRSARPRSRWDTRTRHATRRTRRAHISACMQTRSSRRVRAGVATQIRRLRSTRSRRTTARDCRLRPSQIRYAHITASLGIHRHAVRPRGVLFVSNCCYCCQFSPCQTADHFRQTLGRLACWRLW